MQAVQPIIGTITHYRSRSYVLTSAYASVNSTTCSYYLQTRNSDKQTKINIQRIPHFSLTFVVKMRKMAKLRQKLQISHSDVIRLLRYRNSTPPPPFSTPGTYRGIKHWPGVKAPLFFPLPWPRRLLKVPYSRALVILGSNLQGSTLNMFLSEKGLLSQTAFRNRV